MSQPDQAKIITLRRKPAIIEGWDRRVVDLLIETGIIQPGYTGRMSITFHHGGVSGCELVSKVK